MSSVGQTYFDGLAALLERVADRPPARDRDISWKFLRSIQPPRVAWAGKH
jgi:hypothetical protein